MAKQIGYAVIGLGVGMAHVRGATSAKNCKLLAVCDLLPDRLEKAKEVAPDVDTYTDYAEMLKRGDIDVVSVCTPSGMHADHAVMALKAGKHVLCEKPLDVTVERAMLIENARVETGKKVGGIFQNRKNPVMPVMKKAIEDGELGKVFNGYFRVNWYRSQQYYDDGGWRGTWAMDGGGSLMNQAVHTVDLMQWLMGEVESVTSVVKIIDHKIETEDFTSTLVKFKNGATATFVSTTCAWPGLGTDIQVTGTRGSIHVDGDRLVMWKAGDTKEEIAAKEEKMLALYGSGKTAAAADPSLIVGHDYHIQDMVDAVLEDRDPAVVPLEGVKAIKIITSIYESAKTGKEVFLK